MTVQSVPKVWNQPAHVGAHTQEALLHEDAGRVYLNLHNRRIFFKVLFQRFGEAQ